MASDWRFLISRIPAVANRKIGVEACFATGTIFIAASNKGFR